MSALAVSLRSDVHAAAPSDVSDREINEQYEAEVERQAGKLTVQDVTDECWLSAEKPLQMAFEKNDVQAVGRIVFNVRKAYAMAVADQIVYGREFACTPTCEQAAAMGLTGRLL